MLPFEEAARRKVVAMGQDDRYLAENEDGKGIYNNASLSSSSR